MKKIITLCLFAFLFTTVVNSQTGTTNGTYNFANISTVNNSHSSGFKTQEDKFAVNNGAVTYTLTSPFAVYQNCMRDFVNTTLSSTGSITIKAEGISVCKTFSLRNINFYIFNSFNASRSLKTMNMTIKGSSGNILATHSFSGTYNTINGVTSFSLTDIPFSTAFPASGYDNVSEMNFTYTLGNGSAGYAPSSLLFKNIVLENISTALPCTTTTSTFTTSACGSYTWAAKGNKVYTASNKTDTIHLTNAGGCDSIVTLDLTINPIPIIYTLSGGGSYCNGGKGVPVSMNGSDLDTKYQIFINGINSGNAINGDGSLQSGTLFNAGTYTLLAVNNTTGCSASMNGSAIVTVLQPSTASIDVTACGSYMWHGKTYSSTGDYNFDTANAVGCDSLTTLHLTINKPTGSTITITNCGSYSWNGQTFSTSGTYTKTFKGGNAKGCDSTATLNLIISAAPINQSVDLSDCKSVTYNGVTYTKNTTLYDTIKNGNGCDSVYKTINIYITFQAIISVDKNPTCNTQIATFTSKVYNANVLVYQWYKNGVAIPGATIASYTTAGTSAGDDIQLRVRSKSPLCSSNVNDTVWSNVIHFAGMSSAASKLTISTPSTSVCTGASVTYTAITTNSGSMAVYTWKVNGVTVAQGKDTFYTSTTIANGDVVSCTLNTNNVCQVTNVINSNTITMTVNATVSVPVNAITGNTGICSIGGTTTLTESTVGGAWSSSDTKVATVNASGVVTATGTGTTTIKYTVGTGVCGTNASTTVNVAPIKMLPITGPTAVCQGSTVPLSNATVGTGVWSVTNTRGTIDQNGVLTGTSAGGNAIVQFAVTNGAGCSSKTNYNVFVNALPAKPSVSSPTSIYCVGSNYQLTGTPAGGSWKNISSTWVFVNGTGVLNIYGAGSFSIAYETPANANGCVNSSVFTRTAVKCVPREIPIASETNAPITKLSIYPNPARGVVTVSINNYELKINNGTQLTITDMAGKVLKAQTVTEKQTKVNINGLKPGMYLVTMQSAEGKTTEKLMVE